MMTDGKHEGTPADVEGDDALWRLLERAPRPRPVSPYFARRVLREVVQAGARPAAGGMANWLAGRWQAVCWTPVACALGVVVLLAAGGGGFAWTRGHSPVAPAVTYRLESPTPAVVDVRTTAPSDAVVEDNVAPMPSVAFSAEPVVTAQDVEVIADLDNLLSHEESRLWTEDDTARF